MVRWVIVAWLATSQVQTPAPADSDARTEYLAKSLKTPRTAEAHYQLGLWCEKNGLKAEAEAEFRKTITFDPKHRAARSRLGFTLHKGHWMTAEEIADEEQQVQADKVWYPKLRKLHDQLRGRDDAARADAEAALGKIDDPRAVPAVWFTFATGGDGDQAVAAQVLGQIRSPSASNALAAILLFAPSDEVGRRAMEALRDRDPVEFARPIVGLLREPWTYRTKPFRGAKVMETELILSAETFTIQRFYKPYAQAPSARPAAGTPEARLRRSLLQAAGRSVTDSAAYFQVAHYDRETAEMNELFAGSRLVLAEDVAAIDRRNEEVKSANARVLAVLTQLFPKVDAPDFAGWRAWLVELEGRVPPGGGAAMARRDHLFVRPLGHPAHAVPHNHPGCRGPEPARAR